MDQVTWLAIHLVTTLNNEQASTHSVLRRTAWLLWSVKPKRSNMIWNAPNVTVISFPVSHTEGTGFKSEILCGRPFLVYISLSSTKVGIVPYIRSQYLDSAPSPILHTPHHSTLFTRVWVADTSKRNEWRVCHFVFCILGFHVNFSC
jgi:hypothetical protein